MNASTLPPKKSLLYRLGKHPLLIPYHRLFLIVVLINSYIAYRGLVDWKWFENNAFSLEAIGKIALLNFTIGIIMRQQYLINMLFAIATSIPKSWPLSIRRVAAKVYHFGGLHSGSTTVGTLWYAAFVFGVYHQYLNGASGIPLSLVVVTSAIISLLVLILIFALPKMRAKRHNSFEITHRIGGWTVLALFWIQMLLIANANHPGTPLVYLVDFWALCLITTSVALPWLRLRKVAIDIERPSNHVALTSFNYGVTPFAGSSTSLSRNPLLEWHAFANVPTPDKDGFRLTISRAGDWTGKFINERPEKIWVKGIPTAGVGNIDKLFNKVIWVATGSGIGPCIPHLLLNKTPSVLVWATRNPEKTYGNDLLTEIKNVQPNAVIWDTDAHGKPDLVTLAYQALQEHQAEAVICISNQKLTQQVVHQMEYRGIPAYGAIWDS
jgi:hypothetical protein